MFEQAEDLLTVSEACELLRICRGAIYPLLADGQLKAFRNGRVWRIPKEAVIQYIRKNSGLVE